MRADRREFEVYLPIGFTDEAGQIHRQGALRKMRGHEEALLYDPSLTAGQMVTELIRSCLVRLGNVEQVGSDLVASLYTADRNYLLLELRRITLGDRLHAFYRCPRCQGDVSVMEDLSRIEVRQLDEGQPLNEIAVTLDDGYTDRNGACHKELSLTLPRGVDEEFVAPMLDKDPLKAQDALMLRCIKRFGTLTRAALEGYGVKILRDLTLGDRQRLRRAFDGDMPGVDFRRSIECGRCATVFEGVMDISSFFVLS